MVDNRSSVCFKSLAKASVRFFVIWELLGMLTVTFSTTHPALFLMIESSSNSCLKHARSFSLWSVNKCSSSHSPLKSCFVYLK